MLALKQLTDKAVEVRESGFSSLMAALYPSKNRGRVRVMALAAYFDASGHEADQKYLAVAGFVSSVEEWAELDRLWSDRLRDDGLTVFHAADFENDYKEFKDWRGDEARKKRLREDLLAILKPRVFRKFGHMVINDAMQQMSDDTKKAFRINAYSLAGRSCAASLRLYLERDNWKTSPEIVFEHGDIGMGMLRDQLLRDGFAAPLFKPKKDRLLKNGLIELGVVPLQTADWLAYEMFQTMKLREAGDFTERPAWAELETTPGRLGIYTTDDIKALEIEMNTPLNQIMQPIEGNHFFVPWPE